MSSDSKPSVCVNHKKKRSERKGNIVTTRDWSRLRMTINHGTPQQFIQKTGLEQAQEKRMA